MAAEPEKKIDESLQAYARKRREDAGEPLDLHPATRRILQGEVAKLRAGQPRESGAWWQSLLLVWPRFAAAFAIFMMLALGVWVFVHNERRQSQGVMDMAARGTTPAEQPVVEESIELKQKNKAEPDGLASTLGREETSDSKKVAEKMPAQVLAFDDSAKLQLRDAEKPASPAAEASKSVALKLEPPAQQAAKAGETLLSVAANDKLSDLDGSARLAKQLSSDSTARLYRQPDSSGLKADSFSKESLGASVSSTITAGVSLAANKPTEANSQNFAYADTNLGLTPLFAEGFAVNGKATNAGGTPPIDSYTILPAQSLAVATTEWAATDAQSLVENEAIRGRGLDRAQEFQRRDGNSPQILQRFAVEQVNNRIRIRDGDGSIYEGNILADTDPRTEVLKQEAKDELRENRDAQLRRKLNESDQPTMPVHFRASGTNKARQLVVINGEMWGEEQLVRSRQMANASAAPAPKRATALAADSPRPSQPPTASATAGQSAAVGGRTSAATTNAKASSVTNAAFRASTIRARVQIGRTNEIELNAVRMK